MLRQVVPVRGSIVGHCYYDATERDLSVGAEDKAEGFRAGDVANRRQCCISACLCLTMRR